MEHFLPAFIVSFLTSAIVVFFVRIRLKRRIVMQKEHLRLVQEQNDLLKEILARLSK